MDLFNNLVKTVVDVSEQLSNAFASLQGIHDIGANVASAGTGLMWKVFNARRKDSNEACSLWVHSLFLSFLLYKFHFHTHTHRFLKSVYLKNNPRKCKK